jgi:DNA repair protein RadC
MERLGSAIGTVSRPEAAQHYRQRLKGPCKRQEATMYMETGGRPDTGQARKRELLKTLYELEKRTPNVSSPEDAALHFLKYRNKRIEYFFSISVDNKNNIIKKHELSKGTVDQAATYIQEVLKATMRCDGSGIIFGHNHPGGDPRPSRQDIELTRQLKRAADLISIRLLDHIIVTRFGHYSFQREGML